MNIQHLILSVIANERPGIVSEIADAVKENGANWLESSLSSLDQHFAGIVHISVQEENSAALIGKLESLSEQNIHVQITQNASGNTTANGNTLSIELEANDREGIVEEITRALANANINVNKLESRRESAPMAGYDMFHANLDINLPVGMNKDDVEILLESLSDDIMVSLTE